ncbi:hypothetical protein DFO80_1611 [Rhodobacter sp. 140A]|uniref:Sulfotransferase family protein n=1 Tax=bioreactor metagenome TaxID=1076179 RepID=A0A644U737_9ZZZZ|nr:hypothetical protein DFO80_1611 [Rhodobacter sp. 140A]
MRTVCHIGHHKTGTTSLQAFLAQNSLSLLKVGILYPWVETQGAAVMMAKAARGSDKAEILPINVREAHNALAFRMLADRREHWRVPPYHKELPHSNQMLIGLRNQLESLSPADVVLCSEVMSHFGKTAADEITRLRQNGLRPAQEFTLWCTLRRPDEQLISWHGQQVRFGNAPAPLSDPEHGLNLNWLHVDYRGVVAPWLQLIPETQLMLRPYAETLQQGGSVNDFLKNSGIGFPKALLPAPKMNVSRHPAVVTLLREANRDLPRPLAQEIAHVVDQLAPDLALPPARDIESLGAAARARLLAHFRPIHVWLSQTSGRDAFFPDLEEMALCRPMPEAEALRILLDQLVPDRLGPDASPDAAAYLAVLRDAPSASMAISGGAGAP